VSGLTPNTAATPSTRSPILVITPENQGTLKVLIFGDSQTGGARGTGSKIREKLIAAGLSANNVHVSTNVSMTTEFLIEMATFNSGRGDFKGESPLLNNDARWRTPRGRHATHWIPSSATPFPTSEYDIVFMFAGGNDTNAVGKWYSTYLNTGGSVSRLASLFGSKLIWIGPAPSTRITGRVPLERAGGNADIYLTGPTARVDGTPMTAAQRREEYNNKLKITLANRPGFLGDEANTGVLYLDVRDIPSRSLPGAVEQLPGVYFPNLGDGLHIHSGTHGRTTVERVSSWAVEQAQTTEVSQVASGQRDRERAMASALAGPRPGSPNISLGAFSPCASSSRIPGGNPAIPLARGDGVKIIPPVKRWVNAIGDNPPHITTLPAHPSPPLSTWRRATNFMQRRGRRGTAESYVRNHGGVDIYGPWGTPALAVADARVVHSSLTKHGANFQPQTGERHAPISWWGPGFSSYGHIVVLELSSPAPSIPGSPPESKRWVLYAHLANISVQVGQNVPAGFQIGTMGNTNGRREFPNHIFTGPHLHFELSSRRYPLGRRDKVSTASWAYTLDPTSLLCPCGSPTVTPHPEGRSGQNPWRPGARCGNDEASSAEPTADLTDLRSNLL